MLPLRTIRPRPSRAAGAALLAAGALLAPVAPASAVLRSSPAPVADHPALAQVDNGEGTICTGALVAPRVVLTAAHCLLGQRATHVVLGRRTTSDDDGGQRLRVRRQAIDPGWIVRGRAILNADVALLELEARPRDVTPLPLIDRADAALIAPGRSATVIGWGVGRWADLDPDEEHTGLNAGVIGAGELRAGSAPVRSDRSCDAFTRRVARSLLDDGSDDSVLAPDALCVGAATGSPATVACTGDAGGPLLVETPRGPAIAAINSFGAARCVGNVSAYTRLLGSPARRWLDRHLVAGRLVRHPKPATSGDRPAVAHR